MGKQIKILTVLHTVSVYGSIRSMQVFASVDSVMAERGQVFLPLFATFSEPFTRNMS